MTLYYDENGNDVYSSFVEVPSYRIDEVKNIKNTKGKKIVTTNTYIFITSKDGTKKSASKKFVFLSENESLEELFLLGNEELEKRDQAFKTENIDSIMDGERKKELKKLKTLERLKQQKKEIEEKIKSLEK